MAVQQVRRHRQARHRIERAVRDALTAPPGLGQGSQAQRPVVDAHETLDVDPQPLRAVGTDGSDQCAGRAVVGEPVPAADGSSRRGGLLGAGHGDTGRATKCSTSHSLPS